MLLKENCSPESAPLDQLKQLLCFELTQVHALPLQVLEQLTHLSKNSVVSDSYGDDVSLGVAAAAS